MSKFARPTIPNSLPVAAVMGILPLVGILFWGWDWREITILFFLDIAWLCIGALIEIVRAHSTDRKTKESTIFAFSIGVGALLYTLSIVFLSYVDITFPLYPLLLVSTVSLARYVYEAVRQPARSFHDIQQLRFLPYIGLLFAGAFVGGVSVEIYHLSGSAIAFTLVILKIVLDANIGRVLIAVGRY